MADALERAPDNQVCNREFVSASGKLDVGGTFVYEKDEQFRNAVDGLRLLLQSRLLDEDLTDLITHALDDAAMESFAKLSEEVEDGYDARIAILKRFDNAYSMNLNKQEAVGAVRSLALRFEGPSAT